MITLTFTNGGMDSERSVMLSALRHYRAHTYDDTEARVLEGVLTRLAKTSCGSPRCTYCDPEPELQRAYTPARPARGGE